MSASASVRVEVQGHVGRLTLARPARHNVFDEQMIGELTDGLHALDGDRSARAIVLAADGESFCAGADLAWMRRATELAPEDGETDAMRLATLLAVLDRCGKPTVARVQGAAYGGGLGLVAACDVAIGAAKARFAFTEVKLGLVPAIVGPWVVAAIGERAARRYWLTGEAFGAAEAHRIGLLCEVVADEPALDAAVERILEHLAGNGPEAMREAKGLLRALRGRPADDALAVETARLLARVRASPEGREGVAAFLEKRTPRWGRG